MKLARRYLTCRFRVMISAFVLASINFSNVRVHRSRNTPFPICNSLHALSPWIVEFFSAIKNPAKAMTHAIAVQASSYLGHVNKGNCRIGSAASLLFLAKY